MNLKVKTPQLSRTPRNTVSNPRNSGATLFMTLYYAVWPDKSISIVHAKNHIEAFWFLDEEADPYAADIWCATHRAMITSERINRTGRLAFTLDEESGWEKVVFPSYHTLLGGIGK
jgi:hypothetical protein